jgi:hypothetical protein
MFAILGRVRAGTSLLAQVSFRRLWLGQTVSVFGSQVTVLALPLTAVIVLHASTVQVGLLTAAAYAAFIVIGLPVGVWVDRMRRRPVMVAADLLRALVLGSVPVAAALRDLTLVQLYVVALVSGVGTVFFDVAYMSYLPGLVGRERLVEANAKLRATQALAQVAGPSLGGILVELLTAPITLLADAASFLVSVGTLIAIRVPEPAPSAPESRSLSGEMAEGLRFVSGHRILRMIAASTGSANLFMSAYMAIGVVFLVRQIGLTPGLIGLLMSMGAAGGVLGALTARSLARLMGSARIVWLSPSVTAPFALLIPLTFPGPGLVLFAVGDFALYLGAVVYNVNQTSFRQILCPNRMLGRVNATMRFLAWGTIPVGALVGGVLGGWLGNRGGLWVAVTGTALAPLFLVFSPLRGMRDLLPDADPEQARAPQDSQSPSVSQ